MKYRELLIVLVATLLIAPLGLPPGSTTRRVRVIVAVDREKFDPSRIDGIGGRIVGEFEIIPAVVVELLEDSLEALKELPGVVRVEYDGVVRALAVSSRGRPQPPQVVPWGIERIGAPDVWPITNGSADLDRDGGSEVEVAVLDTGIDYDHPDLSANVEWGICLVLYRISTKPRDWNDRNGHGTHVAGTIAAAYNEIGVVGAAHGVELYAIKVLNDAGYGYWSDVIEGIEWALRGPDRIIDSDGDGAIIGDPDDDAAEVVSMSFGSSSAPEAVRDAIRLAYSMGVVFVASSGNEGEASPCYPAAFDEVIAVGVIDEDDNVPSWSNRNPELAAPGVDILSTYRNGGYAMLSGTSMACPHVSATAALVQATRLTRGKAPLRPDDLRAILRETADDLGDLGYDALYGYGVVRADRAVSEALLKE